MIARDDETGRYWHMTDLGCYPVYHICDDGETLCAECANDPKNPVHTDAPNDGWRIIASDVNYEDAELFCANCNARIPSAYAEDCRTPASRT